VGEERPAGDVVVVAVISPGLNVGVHLRCNVGVDVELRQVRGDAINDSGSLAGIERRIVELGARRNDAQIEKLYGGWISGRDLECAEAKVWTALLTYAKRNQVGLAALDGNQREASCLAREREHGVDVLMLVDGVGVMLNFGLVRAVHGIEPRGKRVPGRSVGRRRSGTLCARGEGDNARSQQRNGYPRARHDGWRRE